MSVRSEPRFIALIPAAGFGTRLGAVIPKQFLRFGGRSVLAHSVYALLRIDWIEQVHVVVAPAPAAGDSDRRALDDAFDHPRAATRLKVHAVGGASRRDSVLAGLQEAERGASADHWVMVHDAARPGLPEGCVQALREAIRDGAPGALLAMPVRDTVKRAATLHGAGGQAADAATRSRVRACVDGTIPREGLWLAQTPQVFRLGPLRAALQSLPEATDESSAMEAMGVRPWLVPGHRDNDKLTTADDLGWLARILGAIDD